MLVVLTQRTDGRSYVSRAHLLAGNITVFGGAGVAKLPFGAIIVARASAIDVLSITTEARIANAAAWGRAR